jgi:hypothetical protein
MHQSRPKWTNRNLAIKEFIKENLTIADFGCGDKDILNYINPKEYIGLDNNNYADIKIDFNKERISLNKKYDYGLILGVLEYLNSPYKLIEESKLYVDTLLILIYPKKNKKLVWKQSLSIQDTLLFLKSLYSNVTEHTLGPYTLFECRSE